MEAVAKSDAPFWGAVEWLLFNVKEPSEWKNALQCFYVMPRLRYVQVRHWGSIKHDPMAIKAIQEFIKLEVCDKHSPAIGQSQNEN